MVWNVQSANPSASDFAQASYQAAYLYEKEFYGQILRALCFVRRLVSHCGCPGG